MSTAQGPNADRRDRQPRVIDLEDQGSWPTTLVELAWELASSDPDDLANDERAGRQIRDAIAGSRIRGFHCTRLLDEEVDAIRTAGLRPLTRDLALGRLRTAAEKCALTPGELQTLKDGYDRAVGGWAEREGLLGFCLIARTLRTRDHYFRRLLTFWGGEALYRAVEDRPLGSKLKTIGRPAVVIAHLDPLDFSDWPDLTGVGAACAGRVRGDDDTDASAVVSVPVPGHAIEAIAVAPSPSFKQLVPWMDTE